VSASVRKFNYMGDVHFISGVVREVDRAAGAVTITISGVNQRGEPTCDGRVIVILAPSDGGPVAIPDYEPGDVPEPSGP